MAKRRDPYRWFVAVGVGLAAAAGGALAYGPGVGPVPAYGLAVSMATFILCAYDKRVAGTEGMRVPESVLLGAAFLGGSLGLLLAMRLFRHKTRKKSFRRKLLVIVALQIGVGVYLLSRSTDLRQFVIERSSSWSGTAA